MLTYADAGKPVNTQGVAFAYLDRVTNLDKATDAARPAAADAEHAEEDQVSALGRSTPARLATAANTSARSPLAAGEPQSGMLLLHSDGEQGGGRMGGWGVGVTRELSSPLGGHVSPEERPGGGRGGGDEGGGVFTVEINSDEQKLQAHLQVRVLTYAGVC
jgi:hypothetical protein